ncbi:MAG TPA: translation elongation factor Ts [Verrucomicrobia bacterium]|nr:translation elongation factor Ts [Verrucomicrobiota bacterium]
MEITASMVKELRDATNVSMMECKKALAECAGNMDEAIKKLRERGVAVAAKRAEKAANQGIIASIESADGKTIGMVEVNCETDFVARNDDFKAFVKTVAAKSIETDATLSEVLKDTLMEKVAATGENLKIRRNIRYTLAGTGKLCSYIHMGGKVGVLIEVSCKKADTQDNPAFVEMVKDLTLHIAAANPAYLTSSEIPADVIASEREIYAKQIEGKPANMVEKIVDGKLNKFFAESCLISQGFVKEPKQTITELLEAIAKPMGETFAIKRFTRYQLGA